MKASTRMRLFLLIPANLMALILAALGVKIAKTNWLGWLLLLFGLAYLIGSVISFWSEDSPLISSATRALQEETGDRSFWLIIPGFVAVFFASPLEYLYLGSEVRAGLGAQIAGLLLLAISVALRVWTRLTLKGQYSGHLQTLADGILVTSGPYRFIRHPGYTGYLLLCLGFCVGFGSLLGLTAILLILLPGLVYRMTVEERLLACRYGDEYVAYMARTKRIIPGIW